MVDPDSDRIPRVPPYSGTAYGVYSISLTGLSPSMAGFPKTSLLYCSFITPPLAGRRPYNPVITNGLGSSDFARRYFRNLMHLTVLLVSSPGVLRWFSSPSLASVYYFIHTRMTASQPPGYPIRPPTDHGMFAPPRCFSQLTTAFLASIRQGILRKPFSHLTILSFP